MNKYFETTTTPYFIICMKENMIHATNNSLGCNNESSPNCADLCVADGQWRPQVAAGRGTQPRSLRADKIMRLHICVPICRYLT